MTAVWYVVTETDSALLDDGPVLKALGSLINIDLPWNPSRLEQRLGRIKRIGQARKYVDMLNLVYHETQDERVYTVLSERLPDTIEDDWIEDRGTANWLNTTAYAADG